MLPKPATLADVFFAIVSRNNSRVLLDRNQESWVPISSKELYSRVVATSELLRRWAIRPGDRVAILSENRSEWTIADFAVLLSGAVVVPIYPSQTCAHCTYLLKDSEAKAIFVSSEAQLRKILPALAEIRMEHIVLMDDPVADLPIRVEQMQRIMRSRLRQRDAEFDRRARQISPEQFATLIYTSGTTGTPKGVMLTHGNLASNIGVSLENFQLSGRQSSVSVLPLSHITARHVDFATMYRGVSIAYCRHIEDLFQILQQIRPTVFLAVPRIFEKVHEEVERKVATGLKCKLYKWAMRIGERHLTETVAGKRPRSLDWKIADKLLFSRIRNAFGGRVQIAISGGAPLGYELAEWYAKIGMRIMEGYGLTETSPVVSVNTPKAFRLGTVGKPLSNLEVSVAPDGELLVRGPSVFRGYWHMPEETRSAFQGEWFKTGDIGKLDRNGFLSITDRKKDLIKTSGGKFIAPQLIETALRASPLVGEAAVIGNRRRFPAVIIIPAFAALESWAKEHSLSFSSREELVAASAVQLLFEDIVHQVNQRLARFEQIKKILVLAEELSITNGTLTPTLKLRRRNLEDRYREQIEKLYAESVPLEPAKAG